MKYLLNDEKLKLFLGILGQPLPLPASLRQLMCIDDIHYRCIFIFAADFHQSIISCALFPREFLIFGIKGLFHKDFDVEETSKEEVVKSQ